MADNIYSHSKNNPMGSTTMKTWNVLPAVLATWSNLLVNKGNESSYALYRQQALEFIHNAEENAELIKSRGEIELRNLVYKHKLEQGEDVAKLGARGGNLSGSNLDVLVQKEKIRKMDEQTVRAGTGVAAMQELVNGYRQAYSTYGTLRAHATSNKYAAWASIFKGIETYFGLQNRDYENIKKREEALRIQQANQEADALYKEKMYGDPAKVVGYGYGGYYDGNKTPSELSVSLFNTDNSTSAGVYDIPIIGGISKVDNAYLSSMT